MSDWVPYRAGQYANEKQFTEAMLKPHFPEGLDVGRRYRVESDDCGRDGSEMLVVTIGNDGDCHVSVTAKSVRFCARTGGGRSPRVRQALLWLCAAIRLDNIDNGVNEGV